LFLIVFIGLLVLRSFGVGHIIRNADIYGILDIAIEEEYSDYIVDQINNLFFHDEEITLADVEDFIKSDAVSDEIGSIIDGYANAMALGNLEHHVTIDEIVDMINNLEPEFEEFFDHHMSEDEVKYLAQTLDDILDFESLSIDGLMQDFNVDFKFLLFVISPLLFWSITFVSALLLFFIFFIHRRNLAKASLSTGIPVAAAGLIIFITGIWIERFPGALGETIQSFEAFIEDPLHSLTQTGFIFTATGTGIIMISLIIKAFKGK